MRIGSTLDPCIFAVLALLASACSLPRTVTGTFDGGGIDAFAAGNDAYVTPGDDAWSGTDAFIPGNDAYVPPNDAYTPPNDAYTPPPDDAGPSCDTTFASMAVGYQLCSNDGTGCTFYVQLGSGTDCSDVCGRTGHTCTAAIENDPTNHCSSSGGAQTCSHNMTDGICTCSWP